MSAARLAQCNLPFKTTLKKAPKKAEMVLKRVKNTVRLKQKWS